MKYFAIVYLTLFILSFNSVAEDHSDWFIDIKAGTNSSDAATENYELGFGIKTLGQDPHSISFSYVDFGDIDFKLENWDKFASENSSSFTLASGASSLGLRALQLDVAQYYTLSDAFEFYAGAGINLTLTEYGLTGKTGVSAITSAVENDDLVVTSRYDLFPSFDIGLNYKINDSFILGLYSEYVTGLDNVEDFVTVGLNFTYVFASEQASTTEMDEETTEQAQEETTVTMGDVVAEPEIMAPEVTEQPLQDLTGSEAEMTVAVEPEQDVFISSNLDEKVTPNHCIRIGVFGDVNNVNRIIQYLNEEKAFYIVKHDQRGYRIFVAGFEYSPIGLLTKLNSAFEVQAIAETCPI